MTYYKNLRNEINFEAVPKAIKEIYKRHKLFEKIHYTLNTENTPFPYPKGDFDFFMCFLKEGVLYNELFLKIDDAENYFESYGIGFCDGYKDISLLLKPNTIFETSNNEKAFRIFDIAINFNFYETFPLAANFKKIEEMEAKGVIIEGKLPFVLIETEFLEAGKKAGIFYKAWELILENSFLFESLFEEFTIENEPAKTIENGVDNKELKELEQPQQKLTKEDIFNMQNKLTTKVSLEVVYKHFEILTKTTNKNNEFYLTNEQLLIFIKTTFIDLKPQKQDFNCKGFVKKKIRKVFYDFYFDYKNKETNQTSIKRKYFDILNDAFNGFNENDYTDFGK